MQRTPPPKRSQRLKNRKESQMNLAAVTLSPSEENRQAAAIPTTSAMTSATPAVSASPTVNTAQAVSAPSASNIADANSASAELNNVESSAVDTSIMASIQSQIETLKNQIKEMQQGQKAAAICNTWPPTCVSFNIPPSPYETADTIVTTAIPPWSLAGVRETPAPHYSQRTTTPSLSNAYCSTTYALPRPSCTLQSSAFTTSVMDNNYSPFSHQITPRKLADLPSFSGSPEDWPGFYTAFVETTAAYNYSPLENNQRLQKSLMGEARETVKSLLIHPNNVNNLVEQLKARYGRPELLIRSQLSQIREIQPIAENAIIRVIPFATKVKNLCAFFATASGNQHLANPTLLEELVMKLPVSKRVEWARYAAPIRPYATIENFSDWISDLANIISSIQFTEPRELRKRSVLHTVEGPGARTNCTICQGEHNIVKCDRLVKATVADRWKLVKTSRLCFTCLKPGHVARECRVRLRCSIDGCQRKHHMLLHEPSMKDLVFQSAPRVSPPSNLSRQDEAVLTCSTRAVTENKLLFRILPVTLYGPSKRLNTYALLDEGSSITMLDSTLLKELGLQGKQCQLNIQWVGGRATNESSKIVHLNISGLGMKEKHVLRNVYSVTNLKLPVQTLTESDVEGASMNGLPIHLYENAVPKILIGLDHCHLGVSMKTEKVNPFIAQTKLGWVVFGPSPGAASVNPTCLFTKIENDNSLHDLVSEYFQMESFGVRPSPPVQCEEDVKATKILERSTKKLNGRFQTGLLWKEEHVEMPDSYPIALKRLVQIENKMKRDEKFAAMYKSTIENYVAKGYAKKLYPEEITAHQPRCWFLPHFGVVNPMKPLKFRLVFDAAAETQGISLNSFLLKGPQRLRQLPTILFHFREGAVAVCADIKEMYHQVIIQPEDKCSQRFLWRGGKDEYPPDIYEMKVMTFGAVCSPCSAEYVKTINARDHCQLNNKRAINAILEYHYVDDYVDSFNSIEEAIVISKEVRDIHRDGGFELRGFTSNSPVVIKALEGETKALQFIGKDSLHTEKVLGLYWTPQLDHFKYDFKFHRVKDDVINGIRYPTKRELLSVVMSVFDPLGFLSHFTIRGKLLIREVWRRQIQWDEPVPHALYEIWNCWRRRLHDVVEFSLPRFYFYKGNQRNLQLHVFVDASEEAFAAVAYWRYGTAVEINTSLICAKTRCAPLKHMTIPRLELQAAVLGCRIAKTIMEEHKCKVQAFYLWTDSTTVLKWINSVHRRYKQFVANRIAEILDSTKPSNWRWVPTSENVADEATRSNGRAQLDVPSRWLQGPTFLMNDESQWPIASETRQTLAIGDEELCRQYVLISVSNNIIVFNRFSYLGRLLRTIAWVKRFVSRCRRQYECNTPYGLTTQELEGAEKLICRIVQRNSFATEIEAINEGKNISRSSLLHTLMPYIDEEGILRVNGRIDAASWLPYSVKRPIILPPNHQFTRLVILYHHGLYKHQSSEAVICEIRHKYWIPHIRRLVRNAEANCNACKISRAQVRQPVMGPLPEDRLTPYVRPFTYTGIDYFGPVSVTLGRRREKRWIALFTCLTIRAIHLEVAHDLSTDACIMVIRNFINRRGVPARIRSDNGTNFIGAKNEIVKFEEVFECRRLQDELTSKAVEWLFSAPANPTEGGVWERMVQSVKRVLRHTLKEIAPREHTLQCFIIEAENVINSRPLTHLPVKPDEEEPLTPNHFLLGSANTARTPGVKEPNTNPLHLRKQWLISHQLRNAFWKRWILEYLPTLVRRSKWCRREKALAVDDLVLICDVTSPRKLWSRGRVMRLYAGADGVFRKADVRTANGVVRRPVSKLAVLDISGES